MCVCACVCRAHGFGSVIERPVLDTRIEDLVFCESPARSSRLQKKQNFKYLNVSSTSTPPKQSRLDTDPEDEIAYHASNLFKPGQRRPRQIENSLRPELPMCKQHWQMISCTLGVRKMGRAFASGSDSTSSEGLRAHHSKVRSSLHCDTATPVEDSVGDAWQVRLDKGFGERKQWSCPGSSTH